MTIVLALALLFSAFCAAIGQILLKLGVGGRIGLLPLLNGHVAGGFVLYGIGLALWMYALVRLPLSTVYPFTVLTLILVGALSAIVLGERPTPYGVAGWALVAAGLGAMWFGARGV